MLEAQIACVINPTIGAALIGVVAGLAALVGNRLEKKRQEFLELRRGIYLAAADAFSSGITYLSTMSEPAVTQTQGREILDSVSRVAAKVHIVATRPVVEAITTLQHALNVHYRALIVYKREADELASSLAENGQIIQRAIQMLQNPPPNHVQIFGRVQALQKENRELGAKLHDLHWRMIDEWIERQPTLAAPISQAVLAVKKELGINIDAEWYSRMNVVVLQKNSDELRAHLAPFRPPAEHGNK